MTSTHHPYGSLDLRQGLQSVTNLTTLIHQVVIKYPADQLPPSLKPFVHNAAPSVRISEHSDELVIDLTAGFRSTRARLPISLLDAQASKVTQWVRQQYWDYGNTRRELAKEAAVLKLKRARASLDAARENLATVEDDMARFYPAPKQVRVDTRTESEKNQTHRR